MKIRIGISAGGESIGPEAMVALAQGIIGCGFVMLALLVANYAIGSTGGHADQDPAPPQRIAVAGPLQGVCNGPEQCREAVRYQIKYGANVIKFMPSGGVLSLSDPVDNPQLTQEG